MILATLVEGRIINNFHKEIVLLLQSKEFLACVFYLCVCAPPLQRKGQRKEAPGPPSIAGLTVQQLLLGESSWRGVLGSEVAHHWAGRAFPARCALQLLQTAVTAPKQLGKL